MPTVVNMAISELPISRLLTMRSTRLRARIFGPIARHASEPAASAMLSTTTASAAWPIVRNSFMWSAARCISASTWVDTILPLARLVMSLTSRPNRSGGTSLSAAGSDCTTIEVISEPSKNTHRPATSSAGRPAQSAV